ncbi:DUF6265 family protein [Mucilaginibacter gossypii]|uniref:DUF6265 family protein n=1 Tax=Mucilaginibacter gossypii TaxID=551996 RepID=UPI000DCD0457|nr:MULTISPECIES: DUF6265 family protein [Mucilaginibacter]QTE36947.1 DUF6265 family protein [Mucilaginibacter gossypii]RAV58980.1 hypothetical protein DIU36_08090 [Mucilaginibacter rubeus]
MTLLHQFKLQLLIVLCITSAHSIFGQQKNQPITHAKWLIGSWKNQSAKTVDIETWKKLNDSTFIGRSYSLTGADTVSSEHIRMEQHKGQLYYIPTIKNQNDGKAVIFTLISSDNKHLIFENPEHDFPQKITYTQITNDSLVAEISGTKKGRQKAIQFPMKRVR